MSLAKSFITTLIFFSLIGFSSNPIAEVSRYEEPIRYRRAVMTMIKRHYDQVSAISKGKVPFQRDELIRQANYLEMLSEVSLDGFIPGSHEGETRAKPEIWQEWTRFRNQLDKFRTDTSRLKQVAKTGNLESLKSVVSDMTRTCKTCHDDFKASPLER